MISQFYIIDMNEFFNFVTFFKLPFLDFMIFVIERLQVSPLIWFPVPLSEHIKIGTHVYDATFNLVREIQPEVRINVSEHLPGWAWSG